MRKASGNYNTAAGVQSLYKDTTGGSNTASGYAALYFNTTGNYNTAMGRGALYQNTTASNNTATGYHALNSNKTGTSNTATGVGALQSNTASNNTADGFQALNKTNSGHDNVASGTNAMQNNTTGYSNTAIGSVALQSNTTGFGNIGVGVLAGYYLTTGSNNIDIGNLGAAAESSTIRIGTGNTQTSTYIAGISGVTVAGGVGVVVDTNGHLGTVVSSARFKDNIKPMDKASEAILNLKPVTFRYRHELDPKGIPQFGLVAEQVEKVNPDLVARDDKGRPYSVRYEAVNAMLLNEFLKEHHTVQALKSTAAKQEATIAKQQKQIEALTTGLQKVSDQLELNKPAPRTVLNNQ